MEQKWQKKQKQKKKSKWLRAKLYGLTTNMLYCTHLGL